jgi:hypothetical protein
VGAKNRKNKITIQKKIPNIYGYCAEIMNNLLLNCCSEIGVILLTLLTSLIKRTDGQSVRYFECERGQNISKRSN